MTGMLRIALVLVSLLTFVWVVSTIRKAKAKIEDAVFWVLLCVFLVVIALFPGIVTLGARLTGVQAPVNFIFLCFIFILLVKNFRLSLRVSQMESKLVRLTQEYALDKNKNDRKAEENPVQEEAV